MSDEQNQTNTAEGQSELTAVVSCGYCKECRHRKKVKYNTLGKPDGICTNENAIDEDYGQSDMSAMLIYPYQESGAFYVGEKFGCVHFEAADT